MSKHNISTYTIILSQCRVTSCVQRHVRKGFVYPVVFELHENVQKKKSNSDELHKKSVKIPRGGNQKP
jgi:hypothetical protein